MARPNWHDRAVIDGLIGAFYDSAIAPAEPCAWCDMLPKVCDAFQASAGSLLNHDFASQEGALRHEFNIRAECWDAYNDGLAAANPWMESQTRCEEGAVFSGEDVLPASDMVRTEFYAGYLKPQGLRHGLCGVIMRDGREAYLISLLRGPEAGAFDRNYKVALSELLPHLKRSVEMRDKVVRDRLALERLVDIMDLLPVAFLLVGRTGRVERRNRAATEMIARGDGLFVGAGGYLATASSKHTADLRYSIAEIADTDSDDLSALNNAHFIISRGGDRLPLICAMYSVTGEGRNGEQGPEPAVALLIKDPQVERVDGLTDFVEAYELTNAEARLVKFLTAGQGLFETAGQLGITKNTARTHMRNIYSKVGTHRQSDLMRLYAQFSIF